METSASLLERLRSPSDDAAWQRLDDLYRPLIRSWLRRDPTLGDEAEDLVQEVMAVLVRELPGFVRQRTGSFRHWLREITIHRLKAYWRTRQHVPRAAGGDESSLAQLADPHSETTRLWDDEHDRHVMRRLLDLVRPDFEERTWQAFQRVALDGAKPAAVAAELGMTDNAVLVAKSKILGRLREEARGLID